MDELSGKGQAAWQGRAVGTGGMGQQPGRRGLPHEDISTLTQML